LRAEHLIGLSESHDANGDIEQHPQSAIYNKLQGNHNDQHLCNLFHYSIFAENLKRRSTSALAVILSLALLYRLRHLPLQPLRKIMSVVSLCVDRQTTYVCFRVDLHLWYGIIVFHVLLANCPAILHNLNPLAQIIACNCTSLDRSFGHESDGGLWDKGLSQR